MIEKLSESSGNVIGFKLSGTITKDDYATLVPEVEALVAQEGDICLLLNMEEFKWEKVSAWGSDVKFGHDFRKKIDRMVIIGDKKWEKWITKLVDPFYARQAKYFHTTDRDEAWKWIRTG